MNNSNYINVVYDEKKKPFSLYPAKLIKFLVYYQYYINSSKIG